MPDQPAPRQFRSQVAVMAVAFLLSAAAVVLHFLRFRAAGALWRDEASSVALATSSSMREVWRLLAHDPFPVLFPVVLRTWSGLGLAHDDSGFRLYGMIVGLTLLGAFWFASVAMARFPPLLALALAALCSTVVSSSAAIRAYGLGSTLIVVTLALVWRYVARPTPARFTLGTLVATSSVQVLFHNAVLVLSVCVAGAIVVFRQRGVRGAREVAAMGVLPALSLLPYVPQITKAQEWLVIEQTGFNLPTAWTHCSTALGSDYRFAIWVWVLLALVGLSAALLRVARVRSETTSREGPSVQLFAGATLVLGIISFLVFLKAAKLPTQPWYYLPLIALVAACLDPLVQSIHKRAVYVAAVTAAVMAAAGLPKAIANVRVRQTNLDLIAQRLAASAHPGDLILVDPWYCGITFARYYRGKAAWITLPPLSDYRLHRYDLLKERLAAREPVKDVLRGIEATLQSGHRVWVVGALRLPPRPDADVPDPPSAPNATWGWADVPYSLIWNAQAGLSIARHAARVETVRIPTVSRINPYEDLPVYIAWGRH